MRCCSAICFSIVFILISSESFSQNTIPEVRQKSLSRLKSGKTVRVFCDSLGAVGGKYVKMLNDTLYLGVDKRSAGTGLSQR
ncbi:MAG: hypothetical protein KAU36_09605, partial [candidate division Zixibacteria bacterium]|nr:hypothetical protein [candidate division Zixibacteria bacterium]